MKKYTQRKDGRYATRVWDGSYVDGKKHYIGLMASSSRELEQKVLEIERKRYEGTLIVKKDSTLQEYAKKWLKVNKSVREKSTFEMYESIVYKKLGVLGMIPVDKITHTAIQGAINELNDSPRLAQIFLLTIKQILHSAELDNMIPMGMAKRITDHIQMPVYVKKERRVLTKGEIEAIAYAELTTRERAFIYLLYGCGIRKEEALALTRFDFNFKNNTLSINKALGFYKNDSYLKTTKSVHGIRTIPMPQFVANYVQGYISSLNGSELFPRPTEGFGYITKSIYRKFWEKIRSKLEHAYIKKNPSPFYNWDEIGIRDLTAHIFRHNYCTNLCYESVKNGTVSTKRIAELLGDTEAMVIKVYSHVLEENEQTEQAVSSAIQQPGKQTDKEKKAAEGDYPLPFSLFEGSFTITF